MALSVQEFRNLLESERWLDMPRLRSVSQHGIPQVMQSLTLTLASHVPYRFFACRRCVERLGSICLT
jgi:hypothetical protein